MKNSKKTITIILKYTIIFLILIAILLSIFIKNDKSFVWINTSNDGLDQHLINLFLFKNIFSEFLKTGSMNTFIWNIGYGMDMFANLAYYIFGDFFSYTSLFVKSSQLDTLYNILIIVRLYLVGISFIIYCQYKKISPFSSLLGAITYTFSGFALFALARHPYFINPLILFPILMIATERQIKENKNLFFIIMVFIMFITSFYFAYMMSLCIMIYGIILTIFLYKNQNKLIIKKLLLTFLNALLGVLLSSFILIPTIYAFLNSTRTDNSFYLYTLPYYKNLVETLISTNNTGNWSIIGLSSIILAIIPQFIKNQKKHREIFIYIVILFIPLLIPTIGSLFAGMSYPNNRWTFVITFILSYIIALSLDNNYQINLKNNIIFIISYFFIILIIKRSINSQILLSILTAIIFTIIIKYQTKFKKFYKIILLITLTINIGYNIYYMYDESKGNYVSQFVSTNALKLYDNANHQIPYLKEATDYLKKIDSSYYNTIIYPNNLYNLSIINNYNSISYFYSIVSSNYLSIATDLENQELGINKEIKNFNYRTQITTLLNTKYMITTDNSYIPYGYELIKNYYNKTYIYKNNYFLPFANLYTNYLSLDDYQQLSPLEKESSLLQATTTDNEKSNYKYQNNINKVTYEIKDQKYQNNQIIIKDKNNNTININIPKINNQELYLYIKNINYNPNNFLYGKAYNISVKINDKIFIEDTKNKNTNAYYFDNSNILINLGYYQDLETNIELSFSSLGTYTFDSIEILSLDFDNYQTYIDNLKKANFIVKKYDNNYLLGIANVESDGILQFQTNYSKGWKVYVDNVEVPTFASNKYFLGINITKGNHEIYLKYTTPYQKTGLIISLISFIIFIFIVIKERK